MKDVCFPASSKLDLDGKVSFSLNTHTHIHTWEGWGESLTSI